MSNLLQAAQKFIGDAVKNNATGQMVNVPWKQAAIDAIMSGDQAKGQQLANNVLQSYGYKSEEEAIQKFINR